MRFAEPAWLFGVLAGVFLALAFVLGGLLSMRRVRRFGSEEQVVKLLTARSANRRAVKSGLFILAVLACFVALAQPQYGRGTRIIPATNLDVVVVLDYSKSMYAQDIPPFRIDRAKAEVAELAAALPGARFGAVAFAGEPMSFPLTSDAPAIKQFLSQLTPNDMPIGGTAIARALESSRDLFARDPLSRNHERVVVLITDGEDMEGDPVRTAESMAGEGITIHVVQVGNRSAEPLPEVDGVGRVKGLRRDASGVPITTSLTPEGEAQLAKIAEAAGGTIVRSQRGRMGVGEITGRLKRLMTEELSEKVETVYAEVYAFPLGLAVLLLVAEALVGEAKKHSSGGLSKVGASRGTPKNPASPPTNTPPAKRFERRRRAERVGQMALVLFSLTACDSTTQLVKSGRLHPDRWFERYSPVVDDAIAALKRGDGEGAQAELTQYLKAEKCQAGNVELPDSLKARADAGFDWSLALFRIAERFGRPLIEDASRAQLPDAPEPDPKSAQARGQHVDCALAIAESIAVNPEVPLELRAQAYYLAGNLEFLREGYRASVANYDRALGMSPGSNKPGAPVLGQHAAFNRAIALRRIEEEEKQKSEDQKNQEQDQKNQDQQKEEDQKQKEHQQNEEDQNEDQKENQDQEQAKESAKEEGSEKPQDRPEQKQEDAKEARAQDQQDQKGQGQDPSEAAGSPPEQASSGPGSPQSPNSNENDRILDMLERAPTLQQELAKRARSRRAISPEEDK